MPFCTWGDQQHAHTCVSSGCLPFAEAGREVVWAQGQIGAVRQLRRVWRQTTPSFRAESPRSPLSCPLLTLATVT